MINLNKQKKKKKKDLILKAYLDGDDEDFNYEDLAFLTKKFK